MEPVRELSLVREVSTSVRTESRDDTDMPTMEVRFAPFGFWYEIDSWYEGRFLERIQRGAFKKTISERADQVKVMFNHGRDPQIGGKLLGVVESLSEESDSPVGVVPLFDTTYNRDLLPGIEAEAYGSSFMFEVLQHDWNEEPGKSDHNPDGLPERTITEVRLYEFGPVTWPANPSATSGIRSGTDLWYEHLRSVEPERVDSLSERIRTMRGIRPDELSTDSREVAEKPDTRPDSVHRGLSARERRERMYSYLKGSNQ